MNPPKDIFNCFKRFQSFLIVSHYHPDGDALGSTFALGLSLSKLGKQVSMYNRDPAPFNLRFLPGVSELSQALPNEKIDCAVMVDCAQPKRVSNEFAKAVEAKQFQTLICIDHHLLDQPVGDIDWIDPEAASTGCVIWKLLKEMSLENSKEIANLIYCTLTVDTGSFRYSNTTADVFRLAGELVSFGASPWNVAMHLEESNPKERYALMGEALKSLRVRLNGLFATMDVTQKMFQKTKAVESLSDEFANIPRSIHGVEVSALFREMEDRRVKVSLRSKAFINVANIAKQFGGGGHEHAAGCILNTSVPKAKKQIEKAVASQLKSKE